VHGELASVRYIAPSTFQTAKEARKWLDHEHDLIDEGKWTSPLERFTKLRHERQSQATLRDYATAWFSSSTWAATTRNRYEQLLHYYIFAEPIPPKTPRGKTSQVTMTGLGDIPIQALTRRQIAEWWRTLPIKQRRRSCDMAYGLLHNILASAVYDEILNSNPCAVKGAGKPSVRRSIDNLPTPPQIETIADAMPPQWRLGVLIGAWLGLRSGEIRELRRGDLDMDQGTVSVSRGVVRDKRQLVVGPPKTTASIRTLIIPPELIGDIRDHINTYVGVSDDSLLFSLDGTGRHVPDRVWYRAFVRSCKTCGLSGVRFHDLRHIGLTYAAGTGATVRELQAWGGHTTVAAAMRYQEIAQGRMKVLADSLSNVIASGRRPGAREDDGVSDGVTVTYR